VSNFSLRRVAGYARYHYSASRFHYLGFFLAALSFTLPLAVFSVLGIYMRVLLYITYVSAGLYFAYITTLNMRSRTKMLLDSVLPISPAERYLFCLFNVTVMYNLVMFVVVLANIGVFSLLRLGDSKPYFLMLLEEFVSACTNFWMLMLMPSLIVTSISLLINICARRSLLLGYLLGGVVCFLLFSNLLIVAYGLDVTIDIGWYIYAYAILLLPVVFFILGYVALRYRQIKW
jgi:hypothetical protein